MNRVPAEKLITNVILMSFAFLGLHPLGYGQTVVAFDDLSSGTIDHGYKGLEWYYFAAVNGSIQSTNSGYYNGMVSAPNVAVNQYANAASIRYINGFNLNSAYLTSATSNGLPVRIRGFVGPTAIFDQTNVVNMSGPTLINFNFQQIQQVTFTPPLGTYFVIDNVNVTSTNPPIADFTAVPRPGQALTIDFENKSVGTITNIDWDFGDGSQHGFGPGTWPHTYSNDGPFSVTLTVIAINGTTNSKTAVINVGPTIDFSPTWGPAPLTVQFSDRSNGGITNWDWNFGDGSPHSSAHTPSHAYTNPGTFDITLIVINSYGATNSGTRRITVDPPDGSTLITFDDVATGLISNAYRGLVWSNFGVIAGLYVSTNNFQFGAVVSTPNVAFNWAGNPASFSYGGPFDFLSAYLTGGASKVRVQGFSGGNLLYDTTQTLTNAPTFIQFNYLGVDNVTFTTVPSGNWFAIDNMTTKTTARFVAAPTSGQAPLMVQFTDRSLGTITNWDWNFGDGSAHSSIQNPSHEYLVGNFNPVLTITDSTGKRYGFAASITTMPPPASCSTPSSFTLVTGTVRGWGCNYTGQVNTACFSNIVAIAAGRDHSLLLRDDGTVVALGNPGIVPSTLTNVIAVSAGDYHSLALKGDGRVVGWNISGPTSVPQDVSNVVAISAGSYSSLALKADGTVVGFGTAVPNGLSNIVAVSAGRNINLALKDDGTVVGWNLGNGADPSTLSNIVAISAGDDCCYEAWEALRADGTVLIGSAFNNNWYEAAAGVVAISASKGSDSHTSWALRGDGSVINVGPGFRFCGGPALPPENIYNAVAVASGDGHDLALIGDGPPVTRSAVLNPALGPNGFTASLLTQNGYVYRLEYKNSLADTSWKALPLVAGNGSLVTLTDSAAGGTQRFYRVRRW